MAVQSETLKDRFPWGMLYAYAGIAVMWAFWFSFVVFLSEPRHLLAVWPLPTIDRGGLADTPWLAALIDLGLIALFGLQHSLMARPLFKNTVVRGLPPAFERCTYVHMANLALFTMILAWQPLAAPIWAVTGTAANLLWVVLALGWVILFAGAWSFGINDLLGLAGMRAWQHGSSTPSAKLKTGWLYRVVRHPMYVGVLMGVWVTARMSVGHVLLALGLTAYVLIAMRYEERDLLHRFGERYQAWRSVGVR
jgi:protein-S-isoprenylcysteine O-methyltransferase Ste14